MEITDVCVVALKDDPQLLGKANFRYGDMFFRFWRVMRGANGPVVVPPLFYAASTDEIIKINAPLTMELEDDLSRALLQKYEEALKCLE
jgi:DNA-binding cell septation regulator SpoVG